MSDLHLHKQALYPPAPIPRQAITESPDGLDYGFDAPGLLDLKTSHPGIIAAVVLKAAMALVNVARTRHTHALFHNFEAARTRFPFIPTSLEALNPEAYEASDVNGPVMQGVFNLVEVPRSQTAITLLKRMQAEQLELTKHAHAPLRRVIDTLNASGTGAGDMVCKISIQIAYSRFDEAYMVSPNTTQSSDIPYRYVYPPSSNIPLTTPPPPLQIVETHRSHMLTWVPGFLGDYSHLKVLQIAMRCVAGLLVVAGLCGPAATTYMLSMRWDVANYSRAKTQEFVEDLEAAVVWLTAKENWDVPVSAFLEGMGKAGG